MMSGYFSAKMGTAKLCLLRLALSLLVVLAMPFIFLAIGPYVAFKGYDFY
jgi:hypothetical protein